MLSFQSYYNIYCDTVYVLKFKIKCLKLITRGSKSLKSVRWVAETRHHVDKIAKSDKGHNYDKRQSSTIWSSSVHENNNWKASSKSIGTREELQRPGNWQKYIILATSWPVGNDRLPENWAYSQRVLKLVSLDASYHKEHVYGLGMGIWMVSEILDH